MRKLLSFIISLAVLALGFRFAVDSPSDGLKHGKSDGTDEKIEEVSEFSVFLDSLQEMKTIRIPSTEEENGEDAAQDYRNVTMEWLFRVDYSVNAGIFAQTHIAEKDVIYLSEDALHCYATGTVKDSMRVSDERYTLSSSDYCVYDVTFYSDEENEMLRYNKFSVNNSARENAESSYYILSVPGDYMGKWLRYDKAFSEQHFEELGFEGISSMTDAFNADFEKLDYCGNYFLAHKDDGFQKRGNRYELRSAFVEDFLGGFPGFPDGYDPSDGKITIDLSDASSPELQIELNDPTCSFSLTVRFYNINNTEAGKLEFEDDAPTMSEMYENMIVKEYSSKKSDD